MFSKKLNKNNQSNLIFGKFDLSFKVVIIGDSKVGKTALINRFVGYDFQEEYSATVGFQFNSFNSKVKDKEIKIQLWDISGSSDQKSRDVIKGYLKKSDLAFLVYDITKRETFENIDTWLKFLEDNSASTNVILIGNKLDLEGQREVPKEEGGSKLNSKFVKFHECSAKNNINVKEIINEAAEILYESSKQTLNNT